MPRCVLKRLPTLLPLIVLTGALCAPSASAIGPCGQNSSTASACSLDSPATLYGSLTTGYEHDYYRFYAKKGTHLSVTLTDLEPPECEVTYGHCGVIEAALQNAEGAEIDHSEYTEPVNGVADTAVLKHTITAAGTYYITVYGFLGVEAAGKPAPDPYRLSVTASPAIYWPKHPRASRASHHSHSHSHRHH